MIAMTTNFTGDKEKITIFAVVSHQQLFRQSKQSVAYMQTFHQVLM